MAVIHIILASFPSFNTHSHHFPVILGIHLILASFPSFDTHLHHFPVILCHPSHSSLIPLIPHAFISFSSHSHHSALIHLILAPFRSFPGHSTQKWFILLICGSFSLGMTRNDYRHHSAWNDRNEAKMRWMTSEWWNETVAQTAKFSSHSTHFDVIRLIPASSKSSVQWGWLINDPKMRSSSGPKLTTFPDFKHNFGTRAFWLPKS